MLGLKRKIMLALVSFGLILCSGVGINNNNSTNTNIEINTKEEVSEPIENSNGIHIMSDPPTLNGLEGDGSPSTPYLISNIADFITFDEFINGTLASGRVAKYYEITGDIEINNENYPAFKPIGYDVDHAFSGIFRCEKKNGTILHTITLDYSFRASTHNVEHIGVFDDNYYGLFGYISGSTSIYNLIVNSTITVNFLSASDVYNFDNYYIGGIFGKIDNTENHVFIQSVYATTDVTTNLLQESMYNLKVNQLILGGFIGEAIKTSLDLCEIHSTVHCFDESNDISLIPTSIQPLGIKRMTEHAYLAKGFDESTYVGGIIGNLSTFNTQNGEDKYYIDAFYIGTNNHDFICNDLSGFGCLFGNINFTSDESRMMDSYSIAEIKDIYVNVNGASTGSAYNLYFGVIFGTKTSDNSADIMFFKFNLKVLSDIHVSINYTTGRVGIGFVIGNENIANIIFQNSRLTLKGFDINCVSNYYVNFGVLAGEIVPSSDDGTIFDFTMINSYIYEESGSSITLVDDDATITTGLFCGKNSSTTRNPTFDLNLGYIYVNSGNLITKGAPSGSLYQPSSDMYFYSNNALSDLTNLVTTFDNSYLSGMNTVVDTENASYDDEMEFYKYNKWTILKTNSGYPRFRIDVTLIASGFSNRVMEVVLWDGTYDETQLVYDGKVVDGLFSDQEFEDEFLPSLFASLEMKETLYVKLSDAPVDPEPDDDTGPTLPIGTTFDIIYDTKNGTINDANYPTTYVCGVGVTLPISVTKENYDFSGWSYRNLNGVIITEISPRQYGDVYLNANYTISANAKKYTIEYVNNEGKINDKDYATSYLDEEVELPVDVTSDYGKFVGWYDNPEFSGSSIYKISATDTGNKIYYARYMFNRYKISYVIPGSTGITEYYYYGDEVTLLNNFTKDGYTFVGLSEKEGDDTNLVTKINKGESGDKTYYVIYKENTKSVNLWWLWILLIILGLLGIGVGVYVYIKKRKAIKA
ncbi:MAG: InlB B-repeat-containing protein [Bacilli bacterium]